jgi:hypothetical protein
MAKTNPHRLASSVVDNTEIFLRLRELTERSKEVEERQSDQRIRFFLTLSTATVAIIGFFLRDDISTNRESEIGVVSFIAFTILFLYGILTFAQIIWNRRAIARYDVIIWNLTKRAEELMPRIHVHNDYESDNEKLWIVKSLKGTLAQFMYFTEAVLGSASLLMLGIALKWHWCTIICLGSSAFALIIIILLLWSEYVRRGIIEPGKSNPT